MEWTPEQKQAIEQVREWINGEGGTMISLSGAAGTGKTTVLSEIKKHLYGNVCWTALTGKAALRMREVVEVQAQTLHKVLYEAPTKRKGKLEFNKVADPEGIRFLVIDECSMLGPKIFKDLQVWLRYGVSILFVGDGYQLPPVLTNQEFKEFGDFSIFKSVRGPILSKCMRAGDDIVAICNHVREHAELPDSAGAYTCRESGKANISAAKDWLADKDDHLLVTWTNRYRMETNRYIRKKLGLVDPIPQQGEPVLICQNGRQVLNGEIHYLDEFNDGPSFAGLDIYYMNTMSGAENVPVTLQGKKEFMDGFFPEIEDWKAYEANLNQMREGEPLPITYGYVSTAHKAQGSEFRRVTVFLSENDFENPYFHKETSLPTGERMPFSTRWLYTAMTRAREQLTVVTE